MTKQEILKSALEARETEVLGYQVNIDNYTLVIAHIDAMPDGGDLAQFRQQLATVLESEILEQKKANVMLAVIKQQIDNHG